MGKVIALWRVFRKGEAVANPALWKTGQITVTMVAVLLVAAVQAAASFGFEVHADENQITAVAGGVVALVNVLLTVATSKTVGLPPVGESPPGAGDDGRAEDPY